jgi:hypothetical protein
MLSDNEARLLSPELEDRMTDFVCFECFEDSFLRRRHARSRLHSPRICIGCGETVTHAITARDLAALAEPVLLRHFEIDQGHYSGYELSLKSIVGQALHCSRQAVLDTIANLLEDADDKDEDGVPDFMSFYAPGQEYQRAGDPFDDDEHQRWYVMGDWHNAATRLIHGRRFFNERVRELFGGILQEALAAGSVEDASLRPVVKNVPAGYAFFRARVANSFDAEKKFLADPARELGAPPKELATNGRMSPAGIPFLYVAEDHRTAVAEVRPSIGDTVVVGKFKATKPLKIFDLTALSGRLVHQPLSLFDPEHENRSHRRILLAYLHAEISRPAKANDTDYLMTQAFTEYIRFECAEEFDGVAFRSVQHADGTNYVLFDTASEEEWTWADWKPRFDVEVSPDDVVVFEVGAVEYTSTLKKDAYPSY